MKIKLSIIVPVYNVEEYIENCLNSIVSQDAFSDGIELIIVNDGSTDNSLEICKQYLEYKNVVLFSQENKGLSAARNKGMSLAKGEYIWFIDSDDWIKKNSINKIITAIDSSEPEVLLIGLGEYKNDHLVKSFQQEDCVENGIHIIKSPNYFVGAVVYIMQLSFLKKNKLSFYEGIYHEDEEFTNRLLYLANKISCINEIIYCVNVREGSITRSSIPKRSFDLLIVIDRLYNFMLNVHEKQVLYDRISLLFNSAIFNIQNSEKMYQENFLKELKNKHGYIVKCLLKSSNLKYKVEGVLMLMSFLNPIKIYKTLSILK